MNLKKKMNEYTVKNKEKAKKVEKKQMTNRNKNNKDNDDNSNNEKNIIIVRQNEFKEENQKNNVIYHPK